MSALEPDRDEIARFVSAVFRHAGAGTYAAIRFYPDDKSGELWQHNLWRAIPLTGAGFGPLVDAAAALARRCANAPLPVVFCPPLATFRVAGRATDETVADGLVLSVDCDRDPAAARAKLEDMLGPATVTVASGGEWVDPISGQIVPKVHCHWRLSSPARTPEEHAALKLARRRAMGFIDGDATGLPLCHPYRWPGSWHRKTYDKPRMARIVALNSGTEIDLAEAPSRLPGGDERKGGGDRRLGVANCDGRLTPYGEAALRAAAAQIMSAPNGKQEHTLNGQCYSIGRLAGAGGVPADLARNVLLTAAKSIPSFDAARPWREERIEKKVRSAFAAGLAAEARDV